MSGNRGAVVLVLGLLVVMTGIFTASSAMEGGSRAAGGGFIFVNGDRISEDEFASRVATVEQNLVMLNAQADTMPDDDPFVTALLEIMDTTPPETVALASIILDTAVYQEALSRGHRPDMEVIQAQIEQEREIFEMIEESPEDFGVEEENVAAYRENIEEVGEEVYWNEHYPEIVQKQTAVQNLQAEVDANGEDWVATQRNVFRSAEVRINQPNKVDPATVASARDYMNSIWNLTDEQGSQS